MPPGPLGPCLWPACSPKRGKVRGERGPLGHQRQPTPKPLATPIIGCGGEKYPRAAQGGQAVAVTTAGPAYRAPWNPFRPAYRASPILFSCGGWACFASPSPSADSPQTPRLPAPCDNSSQNPPMYISCATCPQLHLPCCQGSGVLPLSVAPHERLGLGWSRKTFEPPSG